MSSSVLSSLKHKAHAECFRLDKHELRIYRTASKSSYVDQLILALIFRFGVILAQEIGRLAVSLSDIKTPIKH